MVKIIQITSRTATFELQNILPYYNDKSFDIILNGKNIKQEEKNVFTIYDLDPATTYTLEVLETKLSFTTESETVCLHLSQFNVAKDGLHDDTNKIQCAIACCPEGGTIYFDEGTYLITTIFLKSNISLYIPKASKIIASYHRKDYPILPGIVGDYNFGTWEGDEVDNFATSISAFNCDNINILGEGEIDLQAKKGDWYTNHRVKNIAWRGYGLFFNRCNNINVIGIHIHNSPSWNVHPYFCNDLKFINMRIENEPSMPTTDGLDPNCCDNVLILGNFFSVGDDCIAIKSGQIEFAKKYRKPCSNIIIRNNYMQEGHGGVVLGSEQSGGINNVFVSQCIFKNTDRGLRIKTRRGRGRYGIIDNIVFDNILMENVLAPFVVNMFYNMGPVGGHEEYAWTTKKLPVDDRTPIIGKFTFTNMECNNTSYAAAVLLGLPEEPIKEVTFENIKFHYKEDAEAGHPVMIEFPTPMQKVGIHCLNVEKLNLSNVTFDGLIGPEVVNDKSE